MNIKFNDLTKQWKQIRPKALPRIENFLLEGNYIGGKIVEEFEEDFAQYTESAYAVGVSNGTDGLKLALQTLLPVESEKDLKVNVIVPANGYIADLIAVSQQPQKHTFNVEYTITLLDNDNFFQLNPALLKDHLILNRQKFDHCVIIPVHLYGHPCNMQVIKDIAEEYNCFLIEDASQAHGSRCYGTTVGSFGDMCVYSLYPGKSLGACGDAGIVTTNISYYKDRLQSLRNYGSSKKYYYDEIGWNNRLDPLQAIILKEKLKYLDGWIDKKNEVATLYNKYLKKSFPYVTLLQKAEYVDRHSYHIYCILVEDREGLQKHLEQCGVPTVIHYPIPLQKTTPYRFLDDEDVGVLAVKYANRLLSLPMHPYLTERDIFFISEKVNQYYDPASAV